MFVGNVAPEMLIAVQTQAASAKATADLASATANGISQQVSLAVAAANERVIKVDTIADIKNLIPVTNAKVLVAGKTAVGDGFGGLYHWLASDSTTSEDTTFLNTIVSGITNAGRWVRTIQKIKPVATSYLLRNDGGFLSYYASTLTTLSNNIAIAVIYLTDDATATGTALFKSIRWHDAVVNTASSDPSSAVEAKFMSLSADLKILTYGVRQPNIKVLTLSLYNPFAAAPNNISVSFKVEGY